MTPFDFVESIMTTKKNLLSEDKNYIKSYNSFVVNRHLSYFTDTILYAEDMNLYNMLDDDMKYEYLLNSIRPQKKRFVKWHKVESVDNLDLISEYFGFNKLKAKVALSILSKEQVNEIKTKLNKGGIKNERS